MNTCRDAHCDTDASSGTASTISDGHEVEAARPRPELDLALDPHALAFWRERATGPMVAAGRRTRTAKWTRTAIGGAWIRPSASGCAGGTRQETMSSRPPRGRRWRVPPRCSAAPAALICLVGVLLPGDGAVRRRRPARRRRGARALLGASPAAGVRPHAGVGLPRRRRARHGARRRAAAYGWGSDSAYGPLPYVWVALFAFYFFTRGAALVHLALIGGRLRAGARRSRTRPRTRWTAGSRRWSRCSCTGLFVSVVRDRLAG